MTSICDKIKLIFKDVNFKKSCVSSCCNTTIIEKDLELEKEKKHHHKKRKHKDHSNDNNEKNDNNDKNEKKTDPES